jgi:L-fucose isomerase-like protein
MRHLIAFKRAATDLNRFVRCSRQVAGLIQLSLTMIGSRPCAAGAFAMVAFAAPWVYRRAFALSKRLTRAE